MGKIAFVFSGQGAQKPGMGLSLLEASPAARQMADIASDALRRDMIAGLSMESEAMNRTENTQPLLLLVDLMAFAAAREQGLSPDMVAGFSLGEYAALVACGALSAEEAFPLVAKRAEYMSEAPPGAMAAVLGLNRDALAEAIAEVREGFVTPVNFNCPGQIVVAGDQAAIAELTALLKAQRKRALPLKVSGAFHSKYMAEASGRLRKDLDGAQWRSPRIPIYMNVDARSHTDGFAALMEAQCKSPVYWEDTLYALRDAGAETFVECGPGGVLSGLIKKTLVTNIAAIEDAESLQSAVTLFGREH